MMSNITERQTQILKTLIEEYIETAEPVGSETLDKKYSLGVSPATIRNEMAKLTQMGYLQQPHTSSGRIPTSQAFKFYVNQLMKEKKLSVADEVSAKEAIWDYRFEFDKLMKRVTKELAERTKALALAKTNDEEIFSSGYSNILDCPEFYDIDVTRTVLNLLDEARELEEIFSQAFGEEPIHILVGEDLRNEFLRPCGVVFTEFQAGPKHSGYLGVIGPSRLRYQEVVPTVRYFGQLIDEIARNW